MGELQTQLLHLAAMQIRDQCTKKNYLKYVLVLLWLHGIQIVT